MTKHKNILSLLILWGVSAFLCFGCSLSMTGLDSGAITSINIIDRNGMSETISVKDRLKSFDKTDFLSPQPYQKVLRVFGRDDEGQVRSTITSYHPNGQIKQYLEAVNNRAFGTYREWHSNGQLKVEALVIGGMADINTAAESSFIFDSHCSAWDEDGHLLADIIYHKGDLEGVSTYYHKSGAVWKTIPYEKNEINGTLHIYLEEGACFLEEEYKNGIKHGQSTRYWPNSIACQELYEKGRLISGNYTDQSGNFVSKIEEGNGFRALFGQNQLRELREYQNGVQQGAVKIFDSKQKLTRTYFIKDNEKEGEEIYYAQDDSLAPKLLMTWKNGALQGPSKTWYSNGQIQSHREMSQNKKCGLSTAWYQNGALMLVEEYDNDLLIKGEYYRRSEKTPVSKIIKGSGIATLFDAEGNFLQKTCYYNGKPEES